MWKAARTEASGKVKECSSSTSSSQEEKEKQDMIREMNRMYLQKAQALDMQMQEKKRQLLEEAKQRFILILMK